MALIACPDCKKEISNSVISCPHCGCKLSYKQSKTLRKKRKIFIITTVSFFSALSVILLTYGIYKYYKFITTPTKEELIRIEKAKFKKCLVKSGWKQDETNKNGYFIDLDDYLSHFIDLKKNIYSQIYSNHRKSDFTENEIKQFYMPEYYDSYFIYNYNFKTDFADGSQSLSTIRYSKTLKRFSVEATFDFKDNKFYNTTDKYVEITSKDMYRIKNNFINYAEKCKINYKIFLE